MIRPKRTTVRGVEADWTPEIWEKWDKREDLTDKTDQPLVVLTANYYTPRPYVDDYSRGSTKEGFTFVIGSRVYFHEWTP